VEAKPRSRGLWFQSATEVASSWVRPCGWRWRRLRLCGKPSWQQRRRGIPRQQWARNTPCARLGPLSPRRCQWLVVVLVVVVMMVVVVVVVEEEVVVVEEVVVMLLVLVAMLARARVLQRMAGRRVRRAEAVRRQRARAMNVEAAR